MEFLDFRWIFDGFLWFSMDFLDFHKFFNGCHGFSLDFFNFYKIFYRFSMDLLDFHEIFNGFRGFSMDFLENVSTTDSDRERLIFPSRFAMKEMRSNSSKNVWFFTKNVFRKLGDFLDFHMIFNGFLGFSMDFFDFPLISLMFNGFLRFLNGVLWFSTDFFDFPWIS